jgi:deoxyribodipyrimidine photo-lyase
MPVPRELEEVIQPPLHTELPVLPKPVIKSGLPVLVYNSYNLDPAWRSDQPANRILLLEPDHFNRYPVSPKVLRHILNCSARINGLQVFVGSYDQLIQLAPDETFYFKEHPFSRHYHGVQDEREWMTGVKGYYPSFFAFWKKAQKELF